MDHEEGQRPWSTSDADAMNGASDSHFSAGELADVTTLVQPWLQLSAQLTPLIGESGFCALAGRALRLSNPHAACLTAAEGTRRTADLMASLTTILNETEPEKAAAANSAMLGSFTTLLGSLIGEALTRQLLHVALEDGTSASMDRSRSK